DDYAISVTVTDDDGGIGTGSTSITVNNVAPSSLVLNTGSIEEKQTFTLTGTFVDPGTQDTHTVVVDWGPGEGSTTLTLDAGVLSFSASHQYLDDNPSGTASDVYPITVTITDDDGGANAVGTSITVNNLAPLVDPISGPEPSPAVRGQTLTFSSAFTDVGTLDTHLVTWNFGDGTGDFGPTGASPGATVSTSHLFTAAGTYTVSLTVQDDDGGV